MSGISHTNDKATRRAAITGELGALRPLHNWVEECQVHTVRVPAVAVHHRLFVFGALALEPQRAHQRFIIQRWAVVSSE